MKTARGKTISLYGGIVLLLLFVGGYTAHRQGWLTLPFLSSPVVAQSMEGMPGMEMGKSKEEPSGMEGMEGMGGEAAPKPVMINPEMQQIIGVRTQKVGYMPLVKEIRTVGRVEYDETRLTTITVRVMGYITKLFVNYTGKEVQEGEALFTFYSPELVSAQQEYLLALKGQQSLSESPYAEISQGSKTLLESARKRLLLWNFTEEQIESLEARGEPELESYVYSPVNGTVVEKMALQGKQVMPGEDLYKIADLSQVWVIADLYEEDAPLLRVGQHASIQLTYYPGKTFHGSVDYIYPYLDEKTRTVRVRFTFRNQPEKVQNTGDRSQETQMEEMEGMDMSEMPGMDHPQHLAPNSTHTTQNQRAENSSGWLLKPGMFTNVTVNVNLGQYLAVPEDAVIDTGLRQVVFVDLGNGHFEPRNVTLGHRVNGFYAVLSGLKLGESIVTSANFLLDAESKIRTAMPAMPGMDRKGMEMPGHTGH